MEARAINIAGAILFEALEKLALILHDPFWFGCMLAATLKLFIESS